MVSTAVMRHPTRPPTMSMQRLSSSCTGVAMFMPMVSTVRPAIFSTS